MTDSDATDSDLKSKVLAGKSSTETPGKYIEGETEGRPDTDQDTEQEEAGEHGEESDEERRSRMWTSRR